MHEVCSITLCRREAMRYVPVRDGTFCLCDLHKSQWDASGEYRRAFQQANDLIQVQKERQDAKHAWRAYDAAIRRAWLLAMDDFVRRISQEERVAIDWAATGGK